VGFPNSSKSSLKDRVDFTPNLKAKGNSKLSVLLFEFMFSC
jgi:hypothetical protein